MHITYAAKIIKPEVLIDEETSTSSETKNQIELSRSVNINPEYEEEPDNQVKSTGNLTLTPGSQALFFPPRRPIGPNLPKAFKITLLQDRSHRATDVQRTSQVAKPKTKVPSILDMANSL